MTRVLFAGLLLATSAASNSNQPRSGAIPEEQDFVHYSRDTRNASIPVILPADWVSDERDYTHLSLLTIERYQDVIRYEVGVAAYARPTHYQILQFALSGKGQRAQFLYLVVEGWGRSPARQIRRERRWISRTEYERLQRETLLAAARITESESNSRDGVSVCSHGPWARLDIRERGEPSLSLTRLGHCNNRAPAYRAGDSLMRAAERALGQRLPRFMESPPRTSNEISDEMEP